MKLIILGIKGMAHQNMVITNHRNINQFSLKKIIFAKISMRIAHQS